MKGLSQEEQRRSVYFYPTTQAMAEVRDKWKASEDRISDLRHQLPQLQEALKQSKLEYDRTIAESREEVTQPSLSAPSLFY